MRASARPLLLVLALMLLGPACAEPPAARAPGFDAPIPAGEARAVVEVSLDLEPAFDCDERFDLALYEDRGVELIAWDAARGCTGRRAQVRYVPGRISRDALLARMRKVSRKVEVLKP